MCLFTPATAIDNALLSSLELKYDDYCSLETAQYAAKSTDMDLPVRWQAPETLVYHHFSTASDVYSFGVLVYEVLTYGCTPYRNVFKDEEVLKRVSYWNFETRTRERIFSLIMNVIDNTKFLKHSRSTRLWCIPCDTIQSLKTGAMCISGWDDKMVGSCCLKNLRLENLSAKQRLRSEMWKSGPIPESKAFGSPSHRHETL